MSLILLLDDGLPFPRSLFSAGEQGIWLDPSDFSTLFQDAAGTTPVTAVGQPVGLALDKRLGLALGAELVTNGGFDTNLTGWFNGLSVSASATGGEAVVTFAGAMGATHNNWFGLSGSYVVGRVYEVIFDATYVSGGGSLTVGAGYAVCKTITAASNAGVKTTYTARVSGPSAPPLSAVIAFASAGSTVWKLDNISVKEVTGNHAYQTTSASRPTVEARVNLFTKSEQFDNVAWSKAAGTISANATTAPDGTLTADLFTESAVNAQHYVIQNAVSGTGRAALTIHVKPNGRTRVFIRSELPQTTGLSAKFDLTGSGSVVSGTGTITALANGWYRCTATSTGNGNGASGYHIIQTLGPADADAYTGDGVSGIYVWGAQLETGTAFTTYQRVNTATDYVDVGAPRYLQLDGTDDGMETPSINFTGTDKMTVWAGVRKLSDVSPSMLIELSADINSNAGTFAVHAPKFGGQARFNFESKGTSIAAAIDVSAAAPVSKVLCLQGDIAGDISRIRANGAVIQTATSDQGTGNYGNYPLYIGRRNNASLPLNGRIYQLIIRGAASNDGQIAAGEAWCNGKTRAY